MNKSTSYRHLTAFEERHNCKITEEDIIDIINVLQLYLKFEEKGEMDNTEGKPKAKTRKRSISEKKVTANISTKNEKETKETKDTKKVNETKNTPIKDDVLEKIRNMKYEIGHIPSAEELKAANINADKIIKKHGGWSNLKKKLKDSSEEEGIINLMQTLKKMPTREDLRDNNVSIENLMLQYGSWRAIKENLKLAEKYEEMLQKDLAELKKTEKLTMENCRAKNIDISFLIRKYGGWKQVLKQMQTA